MMNRALFWKLSAISVLICLIGAGIAALAHSVSLAGGIALGAAVGVTPFLSWAWLLRPGRPKVLATLFFFGKFVAYAAAFYFLVTREIVNPIGVFLGMTTAIAILLFGALLRLSPAKEASS